MSGYAPQPPSPMSRTPIRRRPVWALRTLLLEADLPWPEVRAMAPVELLQRAREIHAERARAA